jgi:hypothetical protein
VCAAFASWITLISLTGCSRCNANSLISLISLISAALPRPPAAIRRRRTAAQQQQPRHWAPCIQPKHHRPGRVVLNHQPDPAGNCNVRIRTFNFARNIPVERIGNGRRIPSKLRPHPRNKVRTAHEAEKGRKAGRDRPGRPRPVGAHLFVMRDPLADPVVRARMAIAAAPFIHQRHAQAGAKQQKNAAAKVASTGRFRPGSPPKLVVVKKT